MKISATGGAGYIASHTCPELLQAGCEAAVGSRTLEGGLENEKEQKRLPAIRLRIAEWKGQNELPVSGRLLPVNKAGSKEGFGDIVSLFEKPWNDVGVGP